MAASTSKQVATRTADDRAVGLWSDPFFSSFFGRDPFFSANSLAAFRKEMSGYVPEIDVRETDREITLHADLPGMRKEDIKVNLKNGVLSISGTKSSETKRDDEHVHHVERRSGSFARSLRVPDACTPADISARYTDGVLTVVVQKRDDVAHAPIAIQ